MSIRPKFLIIVLVVLVLVGFLSAYLIDRNSVKAYEFVGKIEKVEGNNVYMHGNYLSPSHPEFSKPENAVDVRVVVKSSTELLKIVLYKPKNFNTKNIVDPKSLKQEVLAGSIEDLSSGQVMELSIRSKSNIYNKSRWTASVATYYYPVDKI